MNSRLTKRVRTHHIAPDIAGFSELRQTARRSATMSSLIVYTDLSYTSPDDRHTSLALPTKNPLHLSFSFSRSKRTKPSNRQVARTPWVAQYVDQEKLADSPG